ncbi:motility associated factor glycosyltransferase family protein [Colwellia sp. M166]|uniref:motility associated factor glycosyltransferase family protein n=1 Tax=Colwellia sp. M166 TaxID=2583805 RepID=UPI00211EBD80|nr:6-hydroxymethylpterin diphosphokinase MptE-like protein [Colwellia sp. M166]UUO23136.1 motility associated factor glycosyltransferase family protein [Colwellia sp. M166]|tara:strand:- start:6929 stop:8212 length:1284 start_codon:yes stop_codon:yes gene_type:complete
MTNEVLSKNLTIVGRRFPKVRKKIASANLASINVEVEQNTILVNGIQLTSNYDRIDEANLQAELIPEESATAFVYGVGLGDLCDVLLKRKQLGKLYVCILNIDLFVHVLNVIDHTHWLSDERVILLLSEQLKEVYQPFAAVPAELVLADEESAQIRDRVILELDRDFVGRLHRNDHLWFKESIEENSEYIEKDPSLDELSVPVINGVYIAAAGPTLSEHFELLQKNQLSNTRKTLIAVDAAVKPLLNNNIIPDIVVSADRSSRLTLTDVDFTKLKQTSLVYFPRISLELIENWPSDRYCVYSFGELYNNLDKKYPKEKLYISGSVIHPAIDLAVQKGAEEIILLGADFGFPDNQTYASGQGIQNTEHYSTSSDWVLNGKGERIATMLNYRGYLRDLERYIMSKPDVKFVNGSLKGAKIAGTASLSIP